MCAGHGVSSVVRLAKPHLPNAGLGIFCPKQSSAIPSPQRRRGAENAEEDENCLCDLCVLCASAVETLLLSWAEAEVPHERVRSTADGLAATAPPRPSR